MQLKTYRRAVDYLVHVDVDREKIVLSDQERIARNQVLADSLGNPQETHSAVHIAGTSGKGTVCYLIDALLRAHSLRTGLTQSPHVYDIRERIQINGQFISEKKFVSTLNLVLQRTATRNIHPTYRETLVNMAFALFAQSRLDYVVLETVSGGRLDSTNVIHRNDKICVITRIGLDHSKTLGETLTEITQEKAGIIQRGNRVIALSQEPEINAVIEQRCREMQTTLEWVAQTGDYQKTNDALAEAACKTLSSRDNWRFDDTIAQSVLQQVFIPGRFEKRVFKDHLVILDGAHNPQKFSALANRVQREGKAPATIILGMGEKKDIVACLKTLKPITKRMVITEYFTKERDLPVHALGAEIIAKHCQDLEIEHVIEKSPQAALNHAARFAEPIIVTGSFYLIGEVDSAF